MKDIPVISATEVCGGSLDKPGEMRGAVFV